MLGLGGVAGLIGRDAPECVTHHCSKAARQIEDPKEVERYRAELGRPHSDDLWVTPNDDGVGVMPRVTPSPCGGVTHDHEARDLIHRRVHPSCLECGAMASLVPARIAGRTVENSVGGKERNAPPGRPQRDRGRSEGDHQPQPQHGVPNSWAIAALHQFFQAFARHWGLIPLRVGKATRNSSTTIVARHRIVARLAHVHLVPQICTRNHPTAMGGSAQP